MLFRSVKADDLGVHLAQENRPGPVQRLGRGIVRFMPHFLRVLGYVGTAAMLWVGAEIIAHGLPFTNALLHRLEVALAGWPALAWLAKAAACALGGLVIGFGVEKLVALAKKLRAAANG